MIGVFGGSFDPIHNGHLRAAQETGEHLSLTKLLFVPCHKHALQKNLAASVKQRLTMLQLAIANNPLFAIDDREITRDGSSYTIDTLISLHHEYPQEKFCLLIGHDAFLQLPDWHRWQELLHYSNIVILSRPAYELPKQGMLHEFLAQHLAESLTAQQKTNHCYILPIPLLDVSSSYIRAQIQQELSCRYLVPNAVADYIEQHNIYRRS